MGSAPYSVTGRYFQDSAHYWLTNTTSFCEDLIGFEGVYLSVKQFVLKDFFPSKTEGLKIQTIMHKS